MHNTQYIGATSRGLILLCVLLALTGGVTYYALDSAYRKVIAHQAESVAEIVAHQVAIGRTVYAKEVVEKLAGDGGGAHIESHSQPGFVPLPAQFLKMMARATDASGTDLYRFRPVSKWNIEPTQGLTDDFQKWAWAELEKQDRADPRGPIQWHGVSRFETLDGVSTFRYMRADPAASASCVECHNAYERQVDVMEQRMANGVDPGKTWKQHQLLGAIEVAIPLDNIEAIIADQTRRVLLVMLSVLGLTVVLMAWFLYNNVSCFRSVTRLSWIATHDQLTGLMNRRGFNHRLEELAESMAYAEHVHVLAYLDLDHFKAINDNHGHAAGDRVLVRVATLIKETLRNEDTVARLGGDEFALIMHGCTLGAADTLARKLCARIEAERFVFDGQEARIGVSIGLVELNPVTIAAGNFRRRADEALYAAKNAGRGQVVCHPVEAV